jgi:hypothetical protein
VASAPSGSVSVWLAPNLRWQRPWGQRQGRIRLLFGLADDDPVGASFGNTPTSIPPELNIADLAFFPKGWPFPSSRRTAGGVRRERP